MDLHQFASLNQYKIWILTNVCILAVCKHAFQFFDRSFQPINPWQNSLNFFSFNFKFFPQDGLHRPQNGYCRAYPAPASKTKTRLDIVTDALVTPIDNRSFSSAYSRLKTKHIAIPFAGTFMSDVRSNCENDIYQGLENMMRLSL